MKTAPQKPKKRPFSRQHWIDAAKDIMRAESIDKVHITRLAKNLNVSRGSFYWHFSDRNSLLEHLIEDWKRCNSGVIIQTVAQAKNLAEGILSLMSIWENQQKFDPLFDQAVREWARAEPKIASTVLEEDHRRVSAIATLFAAEGFSKPDDYIRARIMYFTQLCYYALDIQESPEQRLRNIASYFSCYTGKSPEKSHYDFYNKVILEKITS